MLNCRTGVDNVVGIRHSRPAPWDTAHAGEALDAAHLAEVATFNLYLGHGSGAPAKGVVYVDDITAE
ncbi:hypothetical protein TU94_06595 [Streptomyces cyaneogriseus subsp. noncyanogenus]|uniref:Uncharacterized protein n=1 Tax=Streptomyces cyaneogriseus subsp. noncyanogenus TaxID=477245 RepID=A0A0C5FXM1_9ACTN|nr:hypothetical protein [Streptomyces cyaneogriseus]AJP01190.1 hypothetical protein TU94_06595 [Streptomyces cyaneogriseus subsp. noncyanogenus]